MGAIFRQEVPSLDILSQLYAMVQLLKRYQKTSSYIRRKVFPEALRRSFDLKLLLSES